LNTHVEPVVNNQSELFLQLSRSCGSCAAVNNVMGEVSVREVGRSVETVISRSSLYRHYDVTYLVSGAVSFPAMVSSERHCLVASTTCISVELSSSILAYGLHAALRPPPYIPLLHCLPGSQSVFAVIYGPSPPGGSRRWGAGRGGHLACLTSNLRLTGVRRRLRGATCSA